MPCSILVVDGESTFAPAVVRCLGHIPGCTVDVLSRRSLTPLRFSRTVRSIHTSTQEPEDRIADIVAVASRVHPDVCVAVDEPAIRLLATTAEALPYASTPLPPVSSFDIAVDKWLFASFAADHRLPHPPTVLAGANIRREDLREIDFPVLLKPRRGSNGIGILRFDDADGLLRYASDNGVVANRYIIQTIVDGHDIDCSVLCDEGTIRAVTVQRGFAAGTGSFRPAGHLEFVHDAEVVSVVRKLVTALQWTGVAHVDLRRDTRTNELAILEVNPRFWGSVLGALHAGVNFPWLACLSGLGRSFVAPVMRACRYVSGSAAARDWLHGRMTFGHAGFGFTDTAFRYALGDPGPLLAELFL